MSPAKRTPAEIEFETSLCEAVETVRAKFPEHDPHRVFPLERLADWYCSKGELLRARPYLREAVAIRIHVWGQRHPDLAPALNLLAKVAAAEGKPAKAEDYLRQATRCAAEAQPPRPVELADLWNHLAELRFRAGDFRQAKGMCRKSLSVLNGHLERFPMLSLRVSNNQGAIHLELGRPDRALKCFVRNLRLVRKHFPEDQTALITHYNNIAGALGRHGNDRRAAHYVRQALRISLATWGWKHAVTAATCQHLAHIRSRGGHWSAAAKLYERGYRIRRQLHPVYHPDVVKAALNAAELFALRQDWTSAERILDELRTAIERSKRPLRITQAILETRLARIYLATGRAATAERWLTAAWREFQPSAAQHPLFVAEIAAGLGCLHAQRFAHPRAADFLQQSLSFQTQVLGANHLDLAKTLIDLGCNELDRTEWDAAQKFFERASALREKQLGTKHPLTAAAWIHLAEAKFRRGQGESALELGQRSLALLEHVPEQIPWLNAAACSVISQVACECDQPELAEQFSDKEVVFREQSSGPDHADLIPVLLRLGRLHKGADRVDRSLVAFQRGLGIAEKARGQYDPAVIPFLEELSSLRATDGPTSELSPLVERYLKCHQRAYGHQSDELSQAQDQAADWWRAAGDETRAQELNDEAMSLRELNTHVFGELM